MAALTFSIMASPFLAMGFAGAAQAQGGGEAGVIAAPSPWEMGLQPAQNSLMRGIDSLHDLVLAIVTVVTVFVGVLLLWVIYRYSAKRNPVPSRTSHHTMLELAWTVVPVLILVVIAIPSFRLIYFLDRTPNPDITIKVTAHQWYWEYTYPDNGDFAIESRYIRDENLKPGQLRLLEVDNQMVVPVGKNIRLLTNSVDVIHSFFVPSLGVQRYAIPGRTIEMWMTVDKPGVYYGQCNQICGTDHSRMPIAVRAMSEPDFLAWAEKTKKTAAADLGPKAFAAAEPTAPTEIQR